ncbi:MAG: hypothetical protein CVT68_05825, partial [Actinobacteria bacterium HGW-Actinobacteria-8]
MKPARTLMGHCLLRGARPAICDRGSASPVIVAVIAVVMVLTAALAQVGAGLVAAAQASGAADLSALAAAREFRDLRALGAGTARSLDQACDAAEQVSRRNGAALTACTHAANSSVV